MTPLTRCEFVPYLSVTDAPRAIAFYSLVFGTDPHVLLTMPDGRVMHCEFRVGGKSRLFLSEELPEHGGTPSPTRLGATSVAIHLYVDDCDAVVDTMVREWRHRVDGGDRYVLGRAFCSRSRPFRARMGNLHDAA